MSERGDDLAPIEGALAELVAAYPPPAGFPDGLVNKSSLAAAFSVSTTTIDQWVRRGLPAESQGGNGRSYSFRLHVAFAWRAKWEAEEAASLRRESSLAAQAQLALLGGETATASPDGRMTLAEQRKAIELELIRTQAARERGELVRRADVVDLIADLFAAIRDTLDGGPDRLAREIGLTPAQVEAAVLVFDDALSAAQLAVGDFLEDGDCG